MIGGRTWTEVRNLLWLQGRLMRSGLRSGGKQDTLRLIGYGLLFLLLIPGVLAFNLLLVWIYRSLEPRAAAELAAIIFSFIILTWLLTPTSNTQLVEPFSLPRLFQQPISLNGLVAGSLTVTLFSVGFISTAPFALSLVAGMARGLLSVLPIAISALLFLAATLVIKALIDDVFDLIAEDRRLRMLALVIALLPVIVLVGGQFYFQSSVIGFNGEQVQGINSVADLNRFIVDTNLSRYLIWQPGGWIARAAAAAAQGAYGSWLLWTGALLAFVLVGYAVHYGLLRRLFFGELVRVRARQRASDERVRAAGPRLPLVAAQTSQAFWGLLRADWAGFIRNPYTIRMAIAPVILGMMAVVFGSTMPGPPAFFAALIGAMAVLVLTMSYAHNIFGILDSPGLGSVLMAPVHLRLLLLSHNLLLTAAVVALAIGVGLLVGLINRDWQGLLALVGAALLVQFPMLSVCNLTSVYMPYKIDLEKGRAAANESRTSFIAVFGVMAGAFVLTAPTVILVLVPWQLLGWPLLPGVVAAALYEAVVYALTFWWAGRALEQRGPQIMAEISQSP